MFIKKIFIFMVFLFGFHGISAEEKKIIPAAVETIKFKDLTEFDACFLIYRSPISFNIKDMLKDYMRFRDFDCKKQSEILNFSIFQGTNELTYRHKTKNSNIILANL